MVHTHFVWSQGGNQVFLCGDFTGWIKYQQMVTVEGSSTTFMTICDLAPGLHKFKFLVDGVWRVNDRQPIAEDEYGVSNVILVEQPVIMPQTLLVEDGLPVMEIDGSVPNEPQLVLTDDDIGTTHRRLFKHLSSYKAFELIPDSGKGLAVAPLWDAANLQISGMLTASDFIMILMERNRTMATNNIHQLSTISAWKEGKLQLQRRPLIQIYANILNTEPHICLFYNNQLVVFPLALQLVDTDANGRYGICTRSDSLFRVISLFSDQGLRRVLVVEAGTRYVLGLITLRDIFNLIFRDFS
ncbi:Cystathionine beta-synthase, core [Cynara cardunculus var. scolymus]|uniref:Cystathionine beta-synthase, core n=1 Tax=Cynara cardunculus var. scolymus TaxID=59895 RepID=A0A118JY51_CYNCS|nr:Cystathionine beta-synthase, core [Cynara cardunculus var. scolymus]